MVNHVMADAVEGDTSLLGDVVPIYCSHYRTLLPGSNFLAVMAALDYTIS